MSEDSNALQKLPGIGFLANLIFDVPEIFPKRPGVVREGMQLT